LKGEEFWPRAKVSGIPSYSVRSADLRRRVGGVYDGSIIRNSFVVIVGVGALGSTVARSLAAIGVRRFLLVDPDVISPGNVVRHEARMPEVGEPKVEAMARIIRETNPYADVDTLLGTRAQDGRLEAALLDPQSRPALVIVTVALKAVDGQIEDVARMANPPFPVLHAWVMADAQALRAFVYRAGRTACLYCNGLYSKTGTNEYIREPAVESRPFFEASCSDPAFPGAGNANALAAHVVTELALDALHDRLPDKETHWVFAGNRVQDVDPTFPVAPLTIARRGFVPHPDCPVCSGKTLGSALSDEDRKEYESELALARGEAGKAS
jgi:hypothetical protein